MQCPNCKKSNNFESIKCYWCNTLLINKFIQENKKVTNDNIDKNKPYINKIKGTIPIVEVNLEGKNSLRITWNGPYKSIIEMRNSKNKDWQKIPGIQELEIYMSVEEPLPIIKINQLIVPDIQEVKIIK